VGGINSKDIPCNTHVYFKVRDGKLRMTVCNRSNDLIWGAYGANVVHFSMLQEYVAGHLGLECGEYVQFSDSLHVYTGGAGGEVWARVLGEAVSLRPDHYGEHNVEPVPLDYGEPSRWDEWDDDLHSFFQLFDDLGVMAFDSGNFGHPWWVQVAVPLWNAWVKRDVAMAMRCTASDWRKAAVEWLQRREAKKGVK
jgi:hypothetical protein